MVIGRVDLHTHSSFSDGILQPDELVSKAIDMGLAGLGLTDHDTLDGIPLFLSVDIPKNWLRVPGVEISTIHNGLDTHLLAYYVLDKPRELKQALAELEEHRKKRLPRMIRKLETLGISIDSEAVDKMLQDVTSPGRPHLARLMVKSGAVDSIQEAFREYIGECRPAYIPRKRITTIEGIKMVRNAGGVPVLAHPLLMRAQDLRSIVIELADEGLTGIEVEYEYSRQKVKGTQDDVRKAAAGLDLIETGGSDFHGDSIGPKMGCATVSTKVVGKLWEAAKRIRESG